MSPRLLSASHLRRGLLLVASAALVAGFIHLALQTPALFGIVLALWTIRAAYRYTARRKLQAIVDSGDVARLLEVWESVPVAGPQGRAVERLLRATALASYGWTTRARQLLELGGENLLSDTMEHRVFLEVLLTSLEGDHSRALQLASALEALPLPRRQRLRVRTLTQRAGASALARAFAKCGTVGDRHRLRRASRQNPLLVWPMRYAEAQLSLQRGDLARARALLAKAPPWPEQSVFRKLTEALRERTALPH